MKHSLLLLAAALILMAPKPVPATPDLALGDSDLVFGGEVTFVVTGLSAKQSALIDIQCYGGPYGWWDTKPVGSTFVLGSQPKVAPPDMGSVIYLRWEGSTVDCTARLFTSSKKGVEVLDSLTFLVA
jgi:hypothetical protein